MIKFIIIKKKSNNRSYILNNNQPTVLKCVIKFEVDLPKPDRGFLHEKHFAIIPFDVLVNIWKYFEKSKFVFCGLFDSVFLILCGATNSSSFCWRFLLIFLIVELELDSVF